MKSENSQLMLNGSNTITLDTRKVYLVFIDIEDKFATTPEKESFDTNLSIPRFSQIVNKLSHPINLYRINKYQRHISALEP